MKRDCVHPFVVLMFCVQVATNFSNSVSVFLYDTYVPNLGTQGALPRTDTCIAEVQQTLPIALARPFVESYVTKGTKVILWTKI